MERKFSPHWKSSKQPRKQRKYRANAPLHIRQKLVSVHLEKKLRQQLKKRAIPVRKGDEVKVLRGAKAGLKGKVAKVDLNRLKVHIEGQFKEKVSGRKVLIPFEPSKLIITEAKTDDKFRAKIIERRKLLVK